MIGSSETKTVAAEPATLHSMNSGFRNSITTLATALQKPAGEDGRFQTIESIKAHQKAFNRRCHATWKPLQKQAIEQILIFDAVARREKEHPVGPIVESWTNYTRALWRKVNDAIIWSLAGRQRHVVKRLCLYRERGFLAECNAVSALTVLDRLNADPLSMAVWNDATSCVDVGDITLASPKNRAPLEFLELKEGPVNSRIGEILESGSLEEFERNRDAFLSQYGLTGKRQLDRVLRQEERGQAMMTLLAEEKGRDPVTGETINVVEVGAVPETYDPELGALLQNVLQGQKDAWDVVDGCLWIYASSKKTTTRPAGRAHFGELLQEKRVAEAEHLSKLKARTDLGRIAEFGEGLFQHLALPPFIRGLSPELIGELLYGDLMGRVLFYVDWEQFGDLVAQEGGQLVWGSKKETRRARSSPWESRPLVVNDKLLKILVDDGTLHLSGTTPIQMFFDGLRPRTLAKLAVEGAEKMANLARGDRS